MQAQAADKVTQTAPYSHGSATDYCYSPSRDRRERFSETIYKSLQVLLGMWLLAVIATVLGVGVHQVPAFAFISPLAVHLLWQPTRREVLWSAAFGSGIGLLYSLSGGNWAGSRFSVLITCIALFGAGTLLTLVLDWLWAPSAAERVVAMHRASYAGFMPAMWTISAAALSVAGILTPLTYDRLLFACDLKFGVAASWVMGQAFRSFPWLAATCDFVYSSLPAVMALSIILQRKLPRRDALPFADLRLLSIALGVAGFLAFQLCPATGPYFAFSGEFPVKMPRLEASVLAPSLLAFAARNCMPSLHVGWALLLFWNLRRYSAWLTAAMGIYVALTIVATLGTGQHYLIDVIVAPALVLAVQALCTRVPQPMRWIAFGVGAMLTLGWILAVRIGLVLALPAGAPMWWLTIFSLLIPAITAWAMDRAILRAAAANDRLAIGRF